ncbi:Ig heavy chain V region G4 [Chelonia mydas]|uniref:Ig heavy chain V region G4 n=1 Tax=Chelonia mydas TaxID=8469 RepID=M7BZS8_CHEMY|nr:Ig heavy chain V region G4 [Chelonia mydas]
MPPRTRQSPVWSNAKVLGLISVWDEEAVQSQLFSSCRNYDTYGQISRAMTERGHDWDALQRRVKMKKLQNVYHKLQEANHLSGAATTTCWLYKDLDKILGGDLTSTAKSPMDTSEAIAARNARRQEEESGSKGAEEEGGPKPKDDSPSTDACNQELFSSQEEGSQLQRMVLGEEQTAEEAPGHQTLLAFSIELLPQGIPNPYQPVLFPLNGPGLWLPRNMSKQIAQILHETFDEITEADYHDVREYINALLIYCQASSRLENRSWLHASMDGGWTAKFVESVGDIRKPADSHYRSRKTSRFKFSDYWMSWYQLSAGKGLEWVCSVKQSPTSDKYYASR